MKRYIYRTGNENPNRKSVSCPHCLAICFDRICCVLS